MANNIEALEEGIKAYMYVNEISETITKSFLIHLCDNELAVDLKPVANPRQLRLRRDKNS